MNKIHDITHQASQELADERGTFPEWDRSIYNSNGTCIKMRNSAPVTIAPHGHHKHHRRRLQRN